MAPVWLTVVAWVYLSVCFCCAGIISYDISFNRRCQAMGVMNFAFPITALCFGPFRSRCAGAGGEPPPGRRWHRCPWAGHGFRWQVWHLLATAGGRTTGRPLVTSWLAQPDRRRRRASAAG
jgi:hypothetical protein